MVAVPKMSRTGFQGRSRHISGMFLTDLWDFLGIYLQFRESWMTMIGQYDHFFHQLFLYCTEFDAVVQVAAQNMDFV